MKFLLHDISWRTVHPRTRGFTLVETLAAITLIMIAIVPPMGLTVQSLSVAYYARDQITASNLAQEGIEAVRAVRDGNILASAESANGGTGTSLFNGIPTDGSNFRVDGTQTDPTKIITSCATLGLGTLDVVPLGLERSAPLGIESALGIFAFLASPSTRHHSLHANAGAQRPPP